MLTSSNISSLIILSFPEHYCSKLGIVTLTILSFSDKIDSKQFPNLTLSETLYILTKCKSNEKDIYRNHDDCFGSLLFSGYELQYSVL